VQACQLPLGLRLGHILTQAAGGGGTATNGRRHVTQGALHASALPLGYQQSNPCLAVQGTLLHRYVYSHVDGEQKHHLHHSGRTDRRGGIGSGQGILLSMYGLVLPQVNLVSSLLHKSCEYCIQARCRQQLLITLPFMQYACHHAVWPGDVANVCIVTQGPASLVALPQPCPRLFPSPVVPSACLTYKPSRYPKAQCFY
jgi:hypothetical protein